MEKNTVMRKQAVNYFKKSFYKLMSNAGFGKAMEIFRKRSKINFVSNPQQAETFAHRATFKSFQIIKQDLFSVFFKNSSVVWTKPTPVSAPILDSSKLSFYKLHYEDLVPGYSSDHVKVAYKDTDSLLNQIQTPDLYKHIASFKQLLDFFDYPKYQNLYDPINKNVPLAVTVESKEKFSVKLFVFVRNCIVLTMLVERRKAPRE